MARIATEKKYTSGSHAVGGCGLDVRLDVRWICVRTALDVRWMCVGFALDLRKNRVGFALDLQKMRVRYA